MIPPSSSPPAALATPRRESADSVLAKNLVAARVVAGLTQHELAAAALVSRATIAQLETGYSDPRLSTVVDLAAALGIPPIFLLIGVEETRAFAALIAQSAQSSASADALSPQSRLLDVPSQDRAQMEIYVRSGMLKDRLRAAKVGAAVARRGGCESEAAPITAGLFSAILPGEGTVLGAALADLLARDRV